MFILNGGAVSWKSSKQDTVADSTTKAEYLAAGEAAKEGVWMKDFITELGVVPSVLGPMEIYCDNNGAIAQAKESRSLWRCPEYIPGTPHIMLLFRVPMISVPRSIT